MILTQLELLITMIIAILQCENFCSSNAPGVHDEECQAVCSFTANQTWSDVKKTTDSVHNHTCGHWNYKDVSLLLKRNRNRSDDSPKYLSQLLESCEFCSSVKVPDPSRAVSLGSVSQNFNDLVNIGHMYLGNSIRSIL